MTSGFVTPKVQSVSILPWTLHLIIPAPNLMTHAGSKWEDQRFCHNAWFGLNKALFSGATLITPNETEPNSGAPAIALLTEGLRTRNPQTSSIHPLPLALSHLILCLTLCSSSTVKIWCKMKQCTCIMEIHQHARIVRLLILTFNHVQKYRYNYSHPHEHT